MNLKNLLNQKKEIILAIDNSNNKIVYKFLFQIWKSLNFKKVDEIYVLFSKINKSQINYEKKENILRYNWFYKF